MENRQSAETVVGTIAGCALVIIALTITALLCQLITMVLPLLASRMFPAVSAQGAPKTLVAVFAHGDDEGPAAPVLARYAREGVQVYMILATDGAQGGAHTPIPRGAELARTRAEEARCAADALGIHAPILLAFPDAHLGAYLDEPSRLFEVTARLQGELRRLNPDAVITWGPDGGTGHPDHRLVSSIVTQLARAAAPGVPERVFYQSIPAEGFRAIDAARGEPPFLVPSAKYFSTRISFSAADLEASRRAMSCHRTQYSDEAVQKVMDAMRSTFHGELPLAPLFATTGSTDLFR